MDYKPGFLLQLYRIAYQLVNALLYVLVLLSAVIGGYYAWFYLGQAGAIAYVASVGMLRLYHDIRKINRGEIEPPAEFGPKTRRDGDQKDDHPFKKSGR